MKCARRPARAIVVDQAEAKVVKLVFQMAARRIGNLRIATALNAKGVTNMVGGEWSRENVRNLLNNHLYVGLLTWRKTKGRDYHGSTGVREAVPEAEWVVRPMPHLKIVGDVTWRKVREIKAAAVAHYSGDSQKWRAHGGGRRVGSTSEHPLSVIAKCGLCGRSMILMKRSDRSQRPYYCSTRLHKGACANRKGVPADLLEGLVREKVRGLDDEALWHSFQARAARWNHDHSLKRDERAGLERDRKRLATAVERLTDAIERGESVEGRLKQRQRELAEVTAKLAEPTVAPNRKVFKDGMKTVRVLMGGDVVVEETAGKRVRRKVVNRIAQDEAHGFREALKALGVSKVVVTPDGDGWTVRIHGDAARIIAGGSDAPGDDSVTFGHEGSLRPPPHPIAPPTRLSAATHR